MGFKWEMMHFVKAGLMFGNLVEVWMAINEGRIRAQYCHWQHTRSMPVMRTFRPTYQILPETAPSPPYSPTLSMRRVFSLLVPQSTMFPDPPPLAPPFHRPIVVNWKFYNCRSFDINFRHKNGAK